MGYCSVSAHRLYVFLHAADVVTETYNQSVYDTYRTYMIPELH